MARWSDGADFLAAVDEGSGTVFIQFRSQMDDDSFVAGVREAVAATRDDLSRSRPLRMEVRVPAATPLGPIMRVSKCRWRSDIEAWVEALAEQLARRGLPADLRAWWPIWQSIEHGPFVGIVGAVRLPLQSEAMEEPTAGMLPHRNWGLGELVTQRLLDQTEAFLADGRGSEMTIRHLSVTFPVSPDEAMPFFRKAVNARGLPARIRRFDPGEPGRQVVFDRAGTVIFQLGNPDEGWTAAAARLTGQIVELADVAAYGCVRKTKFGVPGYDAISWWPPRAPEETPHQHMLWGRKNFDLPPVSDAHAIQLLSEDHLPLLKNRSNWLIEQVAEGKYLVTARELEPWLEPKEPDPAVLAAAREDFSFPATG